MDGLERFVEAHLVGIEASDDQRTAKLTLRTSGGKPFYLLANGLHRLLISEFREKNIVDRIAIWNSSSNPTEYESALRYLVCGEASPDSSWNSIVEAELRSIRLGEREFAEIEPVYGAGILMLAGSIFIFDQGDDLLNDLHT